MTRIIAGAAAATILNVPGQGTRPTSDKVREAVFSTLTASFEFADARVLDLYAGSGALGLEAISRGAGEAVLVERSARAARVTRQNAAAVLRAVPQGHIEVVALPVRRWLALNRATFDLVFMDPPYELGTEQVEQDLAALLPWLSDDSLVVVERSVRAVAITPPKGLQRWRSKTYGETLVDYFSLT